MYCTWWLLIHGRKEGNDKNHFCVPSGCMNVSQNSYRMCHFRYCVNPFLSPQASTLMAWVLTKRPLSNCTKKKEQHNNSIFVAVDNHNYYSCIKCLWLHGWLPPRGHYSQNFVCLFIVYSLGTEHKVLKTFIITCNFQR